MEGRHAQTRVTDRVGHRIVLDGATDVPVADMDEVSRLLAQGDAQKRRSATAMNEHSTRAHTVIVLSLTLRSEGCEDIAAPQPTPDTPEEGSEAPQEDDGVR